MESITSNSCHAHPIPVATPTNTSCNICVTRAGLTIITHERFGLGLGLGLGLDDSYARIG